MGAESEADAGLATAAQPGRIVRPKPARDQRGALAWLPGVHVLRHYQPAWLRNDLVVGLALTALLVPLGMAYARRLGRLGRPPASQGHGGRHCFVATPSDLPHHLSLSA